MGKSPSSGTAALAASDAKPALKTVAVVLQESLTDRDGGIIPVRGHAKVHATEHPSERATEHDSLQPKEQMADQARQAATLMAQIKKEAGQLTPEQSRHLHSHHGLINPLHKANAACFAEVHSFKQFTLTFFNLRANSKAFLSIRPDQHAIWSEGGGNSNMVGLRFSTSTAPLLYLRTFLINAREMFLETYQDCSEITISLSIRTDQHHIKGKVDLPPGASITLESRCDRCNIIGLSSFAVDLA